MDMSRMRWFRLREKQLKVRKSFHSYFHLLLPFFPGEIILDDLSFDILEALKNVDDDKKEVEEDESSFKKRKKRNSYSSRTREVVVDDYSDEEYTPSKVRF